MGGTDPGEGSGATMTAKILIVTGDAAESLEVLYPYQRLREEGYDVHIAAPARKNSASSSTTSNPASTRTRRSPATPGPPTWPSRRSTPASTRPW